MRRFYLEDIKSPTLILEGEELRHAQQVLRAQVGTRLTIFDGQGHEQIARVTAIHKKSLVLQPENDLQKVDRRPAREITVAVSFPKSRGRSFLVEKLVELGIRRLIPLTCQRGTDPPDPSRLKREAIAACKQCGINHLPIFATPQTLDALASDSVGDVILLDAQGSTQTPPANPLTVVVGPEGGFTKAEKIFFLENSWKLGEQVLRTETACLAAVARLTA